MAITQKRVTDLAGRSAFVFIGKVVKTKAALIEGIATDNTAIVQVEHVLTAPPMFTSIVGQQITVRTDRSTVLKRGDRKTFFANGWIFGASLAVDIVGTVDETDIDVLTPLLGGARSSTRDDAVRARLQSSVLGVVGTVTHVAQSARDPGPISEHNPNWHEATIQVDEVIKGKPTTRKATVLFPSSDDARWRGVAKYSEGQQGIFILQPGRKQDSAGIGPKLMGAVPPGSEVLTTLHHDDYLPLSELERVRALAKG